MLVAALLHDTVEDTPYTLGQLREEFGNEVAELVDGRHADLASASITIPAGDRRSLTLTDAAAASALIVTADGPIVVSHTLIARSGTGIAQALATPFPETVTPLALPG